MSNRRLYKSRAMLGRTFTAANLRELAGKPGLNVCQYVERGLKIAGNVYEDAGAAPQGGFAGVPKTIACRCDVCRGRVWALAEIRALPGAGEQVNGLRLKIINRATSHEFFYQPITPAGTWRKAAPAREPQPVAAPGRAWVFNSSDEAMSVLPVNGMRIPAAPDTEVRT
jgi:hypothetical protein